nr:LuxR C-terminal-related transcriptional regulator [Streptomyces polyasparticus]
MAEATEELLTVQPGGTRPPELLARNLRREQEMLARGGRMRTLYQHTTRHAPAVVGHYEKLGPRAEVRTLDEVPQRLIVIDRTVAYIPAATDNSAALEIRHPALITFFATMFDRLWRLATPMHPQVAAEGRAQHGITSRQRTIAGLLVEGHTDAEIAERLGMNVRTVRIHVAKLASTLDSKNRAQLGYLICESGLLKED